MNLPSSASSIKSMPVPSADLSSGGSPTGIRSRKRMRFPRRSSAGCGSVIESFMWNTGYRGRFLRGRIDLPSNLANRGQMTKPSKQHPMIARIVHPTVAQNASNAGRVIKLKIALTATTRKSIFMMKKTCLALLSHASLQAVQSGAVNSTVWWRLKMTKCPYRYADASRLWATFGEPQREHSKGLSMFVTVVLYRYIVNCLRNFQTNSRIHQPVGFWGLLIRVKGDPEKSFSAPLVHQGF